MADLIDYIKTNWLEFLSVVVTIISIVVSIVTSLNAHKYHEKSQYLEKLIKMKDMLSEIQGIRNTLIKVQQISNPKEKNKRGVNYTKKISDFGTDIKSAIDKMRDILDYDECKELNKLLNSKELNIEQYINLFINGKVLEGEKGEEFYISEEFNVCEQKFSDIQMKVKKKLDTISKQLEY